MSPSVLKPIWFGFLAVGGFVLGGVFIGYGIKAGLMERKILATHSGQYEVGRAAVVRGLVCVAVGSLFVFTGATFSLWLLQRMVQ